MLSLHIHLHSHLTFSLRTQLTRPPRLRKPVLHWIRQLVLMPLLLVPVLLVLLVLPALVLPTLVLPVAVLPMPMPLLSSRLLWYVFSIF